MTCADKGTDTAGQPDGSESKADQIEQEAATWIVRLDLSATAESNRKAHAAWLDENPRHRAAYLRLSLAWKRADVIRRLARIGEEPDPDLLAP